MTRSSGIKWKVLVKRFRGSRPRLEVKPQGVVVYLPEGIDEGEVHEIVEKHREWIERRYEELLKALAKANDVDLVERNKAEFKKLVEKLVEQAMKDVLGMNSCKIVIRKMRTRWASCSPKGTITINALASHLPDHLVTYIVYHEICHMIEPRHYRAFWSCVETYVPNHKELEEALLAYEIKLGLLDSTEIS